MIKRLPALILPDMAVNSLASSVSIFILCLGIRVVLAPEFSIQAEDTRLIVANSANQLAQLSSELSKQAEVIKVKDEVYNNLLATYEKSLKGKEDYGRLQNAIETIDSLPSPDNIDEIQQGIQETELGLSQNIGE